MKLRILSYVALLIFGGMVFSSTSNGRAAGANQGNTGAPGDNNRVCSACHHGGSFLVDMDLTFLDSDGTEVTSYIPNKDYTVKVTINKMGSGKPIGWGFQMVCLNAPLNENGSDIKNWVDNGSNNYKISDVSGNERTYVEHDGVSNSNTFEVTWTAPDANTGSVSFYAAGNGVNFNGRTTGDAADANKIEITEEKTSSITLEWENQVTISPNPTFGKITISIPNSFTGKINLHNILGQKIESWTSNGEQTLELDMTSKDNGLYLIQFSDNEGALKTLRLLKK